MSKLFDDLVWIRDQMRVRTGYELLLTVPIWVRPRDFDEAVAEGLIDAEGRPTEAGKQRLGVVIAQHFRCLRIEERNNASRGMPAV